MIYVFTIIYLSIGGFWGITFLLDDHAGNKNPYIKVPQAVSLYFLWIGYVIVAYGPEYAKKIAESLHLKFLIQFYFTRKYSRKKIIIKEVRELERINSIVFKSDSTHDKMRRYCTNLLRKRFERYVNNK